MDILGNVLGESVQNLSSSPATDLEVIGIGVVAMSLIGLVTKLFSSRDKQLDRMIDLLQSNTEKLTSHRDGLDDLAQATQENTRATTEMRFAIERFLGYSTHKEGATRDEAGPLTEQELNES